MYVIIVTCYDLFLNNKKITSKPECKHNGTNSSGRNRKLLGTMNNQDDWNDYFKVIKNICTFKLK